MKLLKLRLGVLLVAFTASCTQSPDPSQSPPPTQAPAPPLRPDGTPAAPGLPPGLSPGLLVKPDGHRGLTFYPGSQDLKPGSTPGPGVPSVRLTKDDPEKVAAFYRQRLGNTAKESRAGKRIVIEGLTPAGGVRVTIEPVTGGTQVTIAEK
ncbi:MAG: hypothetical protein HY654_05375 [Acidobacteria bacterium]|nr:hypothetical protein [Acidobacteriota bacterium]